MTTGSLMLSCRLGRAGTVLLLAITVGCGMVGCHASTLADAKRQVPIGARREDAIASLDRTSWYHQACPNRVTVDDLFFYGSHHYDKADVVIVRSEPIGNTYLVYQISSFDEANAWHSAYRDCVDEARFEH
jgi:hypothetical protein